LDVSPSTAPGFGDDSPLNPESLPANGRFNHVLGVSADQLLGREKVRPIPEGIELGREIRTQGKTADFTVAGNLYRARSTERKSGDPVER